MFSDATSGTRRIFTILNWNIPKSNIMRFLIGLFMPEDPFWDRAQLYRQVWAKPLSRVARDYGVSAPGLRKVCQKLNVPVPGRGHWTKSAQARLSQRPPLPSGNRRVVVMKSRTCSRIAIADAGQSVSKASVASAIKEMPPQQVRLIVDTARVLRKAPLTMELSGLRCTFRAWTCGFQEPPSNEH